MKALLFADRNMRKDGLGRQLTRSGVETVIEADSPREAISCARRSHFDLVVCAARLSSQTLNALFELRAAHPGLPILVIAESDDRPAIVSAIQVGCSDYLLSPVATMALREKLEKWAGVSTVESDGAATFVRQFSLS